MFVGPLRHLGLRVDTLSGGVLERCQTGVAVELPGIPEAGKPLGYHYHIDRQLVSDTRTVDSLPTNLIVTKGHILIQVFESTKPDGQKRYLGLSHLPKNVRRPAPLSFVILSLSVQIY